VGFLQQDGSLAAAAFENYFDQLRTAMRVALQDRRVSYRQKAL
jgi:hypothetical protein